VIVETIFRDESQVCICRNTLAAVPYAIVRLVCDREVRAERERQRSDRRPGLSDASALAEFIPNGLDLELDTTRISPTETAARLLTIL
jgi:chloramphenicol 3-O-phosphotransferase